MSRPALRFRGLPRRGAVLGCLCGFLFAGLWAGRAEAGYLRDRHYPIVTDEIFTADEFILDQARFWYAIYAEVETDEGLLHDPFYPDLVFGKARAPGEGRAGSLAAAAQVKALRARIQGLLEKDSSAWTAEERAIKARFPSFWDSTAIMLSVERIRFQRGLKSKFRAGLERSYRYLPLIDSVFDPMGLPNRLKYLPHVESSFYPFAYSKVGAAGMWQFMKSSAKQYRMQVGYLIDERRDPYISTNAAGRMLASNFRSLQSWPLALVAYNHGPSGMARAVKGTGTRDLGTIIRTHYSPSFGFASKNFYAEFLAASSIAMKADSIYPDLRKLEPLRFHYLPLPKAFTAKQLCAILGMTPDDLEEYNLGLRPAIFRGKSTLPKGHMLRLPHSVDPRIAAVKLGGGDMIASRTAAAPQAAVALASAQEGAVPQDKVENVAAPEEASGKARKARRRPKADPAPETPVVQPVLVAAGSTPPVEVSPPSPGAPAALPLPVREATASKLPAASVPASAVLPAKAALPPAPVPAEVAVQPQETERIVDPNLALQASDLDKLAHPMDRFNPSIYNLGYTYAGGTLSIRVGTEETLSHYAEWAMVPEKTLRSLNRIRNARDFRLGRNIRIPLGEDKAKAFVDRREEYYRAMEEDFYGNYYVSAVDSLRVQKGMNLWTWAQEKEMPFWLLQKHNPGKSLAALHPGDMLKLPIIETGIRKWGFTRYGSSGEYLAGISRYLASEKGSN